MTGVGSFVEVDGAALHVVDTGEHRLPVMVCLHSLSFDHRMFDALAADAAGRFRVVRIDFRSHGHSADATGYVSIERCVDDVKAVLVERGVDRCHLVAQSMGGDVALRIALDDPSSVASMTLIGSSAGAEDPKNRRPFTALATIIRLIGVRPVSGPTMKIMFGESFRSDPRRSAVRELWRRRLRSNAKSLHWVVRGVIDRSSIEPHLPEISTPTLVVSGDEDTARPSAWSRAMSDALPDARLEVLSGVGHSPSVEAPELLNPMIIDFCEGHHP